MSFNASVEVTEIVLKTVENVSKDLARRCILDCAKRHNFDADEELRILGLDNVTVIRKKMEKTQVLKFCLPFTYNSVDKNGCNGIAFNEGLYTQCKKVRVSDNTFCKTCLGESKESENGEPKNGTVHRRCETPYYSYEDNRGRKPPSYQDYMKKKGISEAEVLEEAEKQGIKIPREHFAVFSRSKKSKKTLVLDDSEEEKTDLFAQLTSDDVSENKETLKSGEENMSEEKKVQKAQEKAEKEAKAAQKAQEKAERDAKVEQEKAEKAAKAAQKAQEKAERDAKAEQEKAEKAALRAQEKAERDAKVEQEKAEKAAKAAQKALEKAERDAKAEQEKAAKASKKPQEKEKEKEKEKPVEPQEEKKKVTVKRLFHNGIQYLKSSENVLYSPETKTEVGLWCEKTQSVLPLPDDYYESDD